MFMYPEQVIELNTPSFGESRMREDLHAAAKALAEHGVEITWIAREHSEHDGTARILVEGIEWETPVEYKSQLRPSTVGLLREVRPGVLVVSHHVTRGVGELLRQRDLNFVDAAGNASIRHPGVVVEIQGRTPAVTTHARSGAASFFTPRAMPVVLALLNNPGLISASLREIQARSLVSLGTVQRVVDALRRDGLEDLRDGGRPQRSRWRRLLDGWVAAYLAGARDPLVLGRFTTETPTRDLMAVVPSLPAAVSGEAAAALLGYKIRPAAIDLYVHDSPGPLIRAARLRADPRGWITVRRASWTTLAELDSPRDVAPNLAPAPVMYADVIAPGDPRLDDISRELERDDPYLRPFFE